MSRSGHAMPDHLWQRYRRWWAQQLPLPCPRCGQPVLPGKPFDLDHLIPRWAGGPDESARPAHPACNRALGNDRPRRVRVLTLERDIPPTNSRPW